MRRTTLVFIVIVGIAAAIALFARFGPGQTTAVTGLIGSEKAPFFAGERAQKALARQGLQVTVQKAGWREIATRPDLKSFDLPSPRVCRPPRRSSAKRVSTRRTTRSSPPW